MFLKKEKDSNLKKRDRKKKKSSLISSAHE